MPGFAHALLFEIRLQIVVQYTLNPCERGYSATDVSLVTEPSTVAPDTTEVGHYRAPAMKGPLRTAREFFRFLHLELTL